MKALMFTLAFLVLLTIASNAFALRCNTQLIYPGDTEYKVFKYCGKPIYSSMDRVYYDIGDGMLYVVKIYNGKVVNIEYSRGQL